MPSATAVPEARQRSSRPGGAAAGQVASPKPRVAGHWPATGWREPRSLRFRSGKEGELCAENSLQRRDARRYRPSARKPRLGADLRFGPRKDRRADEEVQGRVLGDVVGDVKLG